MVRTLQDRKKCRDVFGRRHRSNRSNTKASVQDVLHFQQPSLSESKNVEADTLKPVKGELSKSHVFKLNNRIKQEVIEISSSESDLDLDNKSDDDESEIDYSGEIEHLMPNEAIHEKANQEDNSSGASLVNVTSHISASSPVLQETPLLSQLINRVVQQPKKGSNFNASSAASKNNILANQTEIQQNQLASYKEANVTISWSQINSKYITIEHRWTIEDFYSYIKLVKQQCELAVNGEDNINPNLDGCLLYSDKFCPEGSEFEFQIAIHPQQDGFVSCFLNCPKEFQAIYFRVKLIDSTGIEISTHDQIRDNSTLADKIFNRKLISLECLSAIQAQNPKSLSKVIIIGEIQLFSNMIYLDYLPPIPLDDPDKHKQNVRTKLIRFLKSNKMCDVTLLGCNFKETSYKTILSAFSPVFAKIFDKNKNINKIKITDISQKVISALLDYIYSGRYPKKEDITPDLLIAAAKYQIDSLKNICEESLSLTVADGGKFVPLPSRPTDIDKNYGISVHDLTAHQPKRQRIDDSTSSQSPSQQSFSTNIAEGQDNLFLSIFSPESLSDCETTVCSIKRAPAKPPKRRWITKSITKFGPKFTLLHFWQIDYFETDPAKQKLLETPKFYSPANKNVQFFIQLDTHYKEDNESDEFLSLKLRTIFDDYDTIGVHCKFTLVDNKGINRLIAESIDDSLKPNICISLPKFILRKHLFDHKFYSAALDDTITIRCEVKVKLPTRNMEIKQENHIIENTANFFHTMEGLLKNRKHNDVVLNVGRANIPVHKIILSAQSAQFEEIFSDNNKCSVTIDDISEEVLSDLLKYIYTGECPDSKRVTPDMRKAASKFELDILRD